MKNRKQLSPLIIVIIILFILLLLPYLFGTSTEHVDNLGDILPIWSIIPFVGMLLSIAICPLVIPEWWDKNLLYVSIAWSLLFLIPFALAFTPYFAGEQFFEIIVNDYLPFIVLLWGLYTVSGGIVLKGSLSGSTKVNIIMFGIGAVTASLIGTTGASMLLIRPILRANSWRKNKAHIIIFFIFIVSNIGGCLTPLGDPPLYLGFLKGVPFFWTMNLLPLFIMNVVILLIIFFFVDKRYLKKEALESKSSDSSESNVSVLDESTTSSATQDISEKDESNPRIHIEGTQNIIFLAMIIGSVILSGLLVSSGVLTDSVTGEIKGIPLMYHLVLPYNYVIQIAIIILAGTLSYLTTNDKHRRENSFSWGPIKEVASLFIGIFITMIPALAILSANGQNLGLDDHWKYFWATGALSSFLDNAPTYLVFLSSAGAHGATAGIATSVGIIEPAILMAVSAGAVFMGANTYIGNAPNFMVKTIAESDGIKMPSFFGYITWSLRVLIPVFILNTLYFVLFL